MNTDFIMRAAVWLTSKADPDPMVIEDSDLNKGAQVFPHPAVQPFLNTPVRGQVTYDYLCSVSMATQ